MRNHRTAWLLAVSLIALTGLASGTGAQQGRAADRYYVEFASYGPEAAAAVRAAGGGVVHEFPEMRAVAARLPEAAVRALRSNPRVVAIEEDPVRQPFGQVMPYGIPMVQADAGSDVSEASVSNRTVCIVDSGYYAGHEDLQRTRVSGDSLTGTGDPFTDGCGHGTHVAGIIAAGANDIGVEGVVGNGQLNLHIVKVFGDDCSWAYSSDLVAAVNECQAAGANVISMSLGGGVKSRLEERKFNALYADDILSVAAAGNGGTNRLSYPASYSSVISVAAVDQAGAWASFSQYNSQVELAAPGVGVLSTVPWKGASVTVAGAKYLAAGIEFAATTEGTTGYLADGGQCTGTGTWNGKVVLCERGTNTFYEKVMNVQAGGGAAAVIYNNVPGGFAGTLGDGNSSAIPAVSMSQEDGQFLVVNRLGFSALVVNSTALGSGYEAWDGTSMATPHVSAVAALVWSHNPSWTNGQIREALQKSALDLGTAGRDVYTGYGLVQAKAALDYLEGTTPPPPSGITLTVSGRLGGKIYYADLAWSGATSTNVDVYRDGGLLVTTANDGSYADKIGKTPTAYSYQVCEAGTQTCSPVVSVQF